MIRSLAAVLALAAAACTGVAAGGTGPPAGSTRIGLIEWDITASAHTLDRDKVSLKVTNAGATAHDLRVTGAGVDAATPLLSPGDSAELSLQVEPGSELVFWCGVPGHRQQGMERRLLVAD